MTPVEFACPCCRGPLKGRNGGQFCAPCKKLFPAAHGGFDLRPDGGDANKVSQAEIYDGMLGELSDFYHPHNLTLSHQRELLDELPLTRGDGVLEIGGHRSGVLPYLEQEFGIQGRGLDISPLWVREQNRLAEGRGGATQWILGDAEELPFADKQFNAIVSFDVFEHLSDIRAAVSECARVLAPGGRLLCHMPVQDVGASLDGLQRRFIGELWRSRQESVGHFHDRMLRADQASDLFEASGFRIHSHTRFNVWIQPLHDHKWLTWLGKLRHAGRGTQERNPESSAPTASGQPGASGFQRLYSRVVIPVVRVLAAPDRLGQKLGIGGSASWVLEKR
jgi:ubiquinone/menaquinone biosynthesis C-methylase UbiE